MHELDKREGIKSIECLGEFEDECVYDISVEKNPFFFANNILVHNTDSAYFSAWPIRDILAGQGFEFTETSVSKLYDEIAQAANNTFFEFMKTNFNCTDARAVRIKANREICAKSALFVKKKRYAALVYDKEGNYIPGGKLKVMGMETQRSDTPEFIQKFLKDMLKTVLNDGNEDEVIEMIVKFRQIFRSLEPWELGTPKRCNNMTYYTNMENKCPNSRLPGHIRAAYNWNKAKKAFGDNQSLEIQDGSKTIVCRLKNNPLNISSIAYPIDIDVKNLPQWFKLLPFDMDNMEEILIDKKIHNLIGVLGWNLEKSKRSTAISNLFTFN